MTHSHDTSTPAMSAETVPSEEFVLVPREPTPEMLNAAPASYSPSFKTIWPLVCGDIYRAMLAAAPTLSASHFAKEGGETGAILWQEKRGVWKRPGAIVKHVRMSSGHMAWRATFDDGRHHHSDSADDAKAYADGFLAREQAEAFSTPTEGPASQTEGLGGDARDLHHLKWSHMASYGELSMDQLREAVSEASFADRHHLGPFDPSYSKGHQQIGGCNYNSLNRIVTAFVRAALTPPETAEAVPVGDAAQEAEAYIQAAVDRAPEPLRRLGEWLANKLDEDDWKTAERMLLGAAAASDPAPATDDRERLVAIIELFVSRIERNGSWDDGCFYFNGRAASELERPLKMARAALATEASR